MQAEIDTIGPPIPVRILGVNKIGLEDYNRAMCHNRVIPWLQDVSGVRAWDQWLANRWDVFILDEENRLVEVFKVGTMHYPLTITYNYNLLKRKLLDLAGE